MHNVIKLGKFYVKLHWNATQRAHIWQIDGLEMSHLANKAMVLKEANQMNAQCNQIRQILCKNSIEMLHRELTFGK